jgi:hypothetical protein
MKPRLPEELEKQEFPMEREGIMFIGDAGTIVAGFLGQDPQLYAQGKHEPLAAAAPADQDASRRRGRTNPWLQAMQGGEPSPGNFLNAGPITDAVNLGTIALRAGKKVLFDSEHMKITNADDANRYLYREYRKGWEL